MQEAESLAHWFAKTSAVINVSQPYRLLFNAQRRHELATGIPANVSVRLFRASHKNGLVDWVQGPPVSLLIPDGFPKPLVRTVSEQTLVVHIRVNDLVGVVVLVPPVPGRQEIVTDDSVPLVPRVEPLDWGEVPVRNDYLDHSLVVQFSPSAIGY